MTNVRAHRGESASFFTNSAKRASYFLVLFGCATLGFALAPASPKPVRGFGLKQFVAASLEQSAVGYLLRYAASGASDPTDSGTPEAGNFREPGFTSNGDTSPSSSAISRVAGITSFAIMRILFTRSAVEIGPSFCQKPKIPGRSTSSTLRIF